MARYSYGWENPNHAAAVLVCIIPLFWAAAEMARHRSKTWLYIVWIGEALLSLLVGLTYSRGGGVAWLAGLLFFGFTCPRANSSRFSRSGVSVFLLPRLLLAGAILFGTGLAQRFATVPAGDKSAVNRLELWHGGLQLVAASPWTGWGKGNSGNAFMQWIQDSDANASYAGMVNTYLHVSVEFGIPAFSALCFVLLLPVVICLRRGPSAQPGKKEILYGSAAGLLCFAVASFFSTLWIIPSVAWVPVGLIFLMAGGWQSTWLYKPLVLDAAFAAGGATIAGLLLYVTALIAAFHAPWHLRRVADGGLRFSADNNQAERFDITFLPDGRTLGPHYGKEIRTAVASLGGRITSFTIYPVDAPIRHQLKGLIIGFGPRMDNLQYAQASATVCAISPVGQPPVEKYTGQPRLLVLPEYDQIGYAQLWRSWADPNRCMLYIVAGAGQDVRSQWPQLLKLCVEQTRP